MNTTSLPKAFSYIRFSDPSQAKGDSYRRQHTDAVAYCKANKLDLVSDTEYTFFDAGISAYSGKLRDDNTELSRFLSLVKDGSIPPGSTLIVESLDRLSREHVKAALPRFMDLLNADINIHAVKSQKTYTSKYDEWDLFQSILEMSRSHQESLYKSERVGKAWREKQDRARDGVPLGKTKPTWLDLVYGNGSKEKPTGFRANGLVSVVQKIFQYTLDGHGRGTVAQMLNAEGIPAFKSKNGWGSSSIDQTLRNVAVLGIYQPSMVGEDGKRVARGEPIIGYYPAIIDKGTFNSARAAVGSRDATKSRKQSRKYQIWQGIGKCALCGSALHSYSNGRKEAPMYLRCYNAKKGLCTAGSIRADTLEPVFKETLAKLNVLALVQSSASTINGKLNAVVGQLIGERAKLAKLKATYKERQSETVLSLIYEAEDAIAALAAREDQHNADLAADQIVDKEDFFSRLDLESFAGRSRANSIVKRLKVAVAIDTATHSYGVDRDGVRILDIIDNPTRGLMFYPAASDARRLVQTQEGTFTPALIDMEDYGDPDDHDGYEVTDNSTPAH